MKEPMLVSDDEKWKAVISNDQAYDGLFFYAVKTTGVFCRPSCKAKRPARENVVFFTTANSAANSGFRPCKLCRPDMVSYAPNAQLVEKAKEMLQQVYNKPFDFSAMACQMGVSSSHLSRLFKQHTGVTPRQYILRIRIDKACALLRQTNAGILEIAYHTGFQSLSNFHRYFKEQTGISPKKYRKLGEDES
ncbi:Bifunctional transcriptional activator/DNA repair enzyme AdaA [Sporomusa rhizae]|uniref:bifunctional transcriptional activator/DNA repair enzyme AdaA n=1 Tax=Sporomusa rhizae TaxID=357999 RepID=UPI00352B5213